MDIIISDKSDIPLFKQIYDQIALQILSGVLSANYCLPSIRTVAKELGISIITIKGAWDLLEKNGFIYTLAGKGCFVSEYKTGNLNDKKMELAEENLKKNIPFYKNLGLSLEELIVLIKSFWEK